MSLPLQYGLRWGEVWGTRTCRPSPCGCRPAAVRWALAGCSGSAQPGCRSALGMAGTRRFMQALSVTEPFHKAVHGPHWYLVAVGTRTEARARAWGRNFVEVGTSRADAAGVPCYLETGTQSNIDFYTKRGFEIVGQTDFEGHTLTGMVRQPSGRSAP